MKRSLVIALALATAMPGAALSVTPADAQVLTGRNAPRRGPPPRPRLSEAELDRLAQAEDAIFEIDSQIETIQTAAQEAGGITPAQQAEIDALTRRRDEAQAIVDRLEAKRNR